MPKPTVRQKYDTPKYLGDLVDFGHLKAGKPIWSGPYWTWMTARGRKFHAGRASVLKRFAAAWDDETRKYSPNRLANNLDRDWVEEYFLDRYGELEPVSKRAYRSTIRGFLIYLQKYGIDTDCAEFDAGFTAGRSIRPKLWLDAHTMREMWEAEKEPYWRFMFCFLALTCVRSNEMRAARIGDLLGGKDKQGNYHRYLWLSVNRSKVKKFDRLKMTPLLRKELDRYLMWYRASIGRELELDDFLFPPIQAGGMMGHLKVKDPKRMRDHAHVKIRSMILPHVAPETPKELLLSVGCHTLRRSGALELYKYWIAAGKANAMEMVQETLGHEKISTTQIYLDLNFMKQERDDALEDVDLFSDDQENNVVPLAAVR